MATVDGRRLEVTDRAGDPARRALVLLHEGLGSVGLWRDFPAQLQAMLKARGHDARVTNAGINGDTTAGMLARLSSAVPSGTQVVIVQPGGNDRRKGQSGRESNIATITSQLAARKIKVIMLDRVLGNMAQHLQPDGQHLTPEGHRIVAARLLPQVTAAIGR